MRRTRILFLCTGNACRSQMAEGWAEKLLGGRVEAYSAGIEKHGLDERAVAVMAEAGVDISGKRSKTLDELGTLDFDVVVTVCDKARESCPLFPGDAVVMHHGFEDPPALVRERGLNGEEALDVYRRVRDEIRRFIEGLDLPEPE